MYPVTEARENNCVVLTGVCGSPYSFIKGRVQSPLANEALIRLDFSGVCHGDVYSRDGGGPAPPIPNRPLPGGHEGIGEIIAFGPALNRTSFQVGDTLGIS
jgi:propanol-preferring alcohol dehydrogenase